MHFNGAVIKRQRQTMCSWIPVWRKVRSRLPAPATLMWCEEPARPTCRDDKRAGQEGHVCERFCEDRSEDPVHMACAAGLTCVAPMGMLF